MCYSVMMNKKMIISMALHKTLTTLLTHLSYHSLALSRWFVFVFLQGLQSGLTTQIFRDLVQYVSTAHSTFTLDRAGSQERPLREIPTAALVTGDQIWTIWYNPGGWVGLWGFLWWAPSAKRKDHHGVSSGWSSVWHRSNTGLSSTQYEQIPIILYLGFGHFGWLSSFFGQ